MHIIIYEGLPTDSQVPIQISYCSVMENVLEVSSQYLNPPSRPDYSKDTYEKLMERVSTIPDIWTQDKDKGGHTSILG